MHELDACNSSYGVTDLKLDDIRGLDMITTKHLCMNWMHAKKADTDGMYLPYQGEPHASLTDKQL